MTSKEIVKRLIAHDEPPRFGYDFHDCGISCSGICKFFGLNHVCHDEFGMHQLFGD